MRYKIVILEEGNRPQCLGYNMFVPWGELSGRHPTMGFYGRVKEQKRRRLAEEEARLGK